MTTYIYILDLNHKKHTGLGSDSSCIRTISNSCYIILLSYSKLQLPQSHRVALEMGHSIENLVYWYLSGNFLDIFIFGN